MKITKIFLIGALAYSLWSCESQVSKAPERPREAWVIRSVLDLKPRMVSIALSDRLWVAYSTQTASLYKAWTGGINFDGAVYTSAHGPQPVAEGVPYMEEPDGIAWLLATNGAETAPEVVYKGHTILDNKVTLQYELVSGNTKILVEEQPEFLAMDGGKVGFQRMFTVSGAPEGTEVALSMHLNSMVSESGYNTDGIFTATDKKTETLGGETFHEVAGTSNSRISKNRRSWKYYRKRQWKEKKQHQN
jgi:cytochrome c